MRCRPRAPLRGLHWIGDFSTFSLFFAARGFQFKSRKVARGCLIAGLSMMMLVVGVCVVGIVALSDPNTAGSNTASESASRCYRAPSALVQQLNSGLTAAGSAQVTGVWVVDSNNGRTTMEVHRRSCERTRRR